MRIVLLALIWVASNVYCLGNSEKIEISEDIQLVRLKDSVFVHISWENSEQFGRFPSNGLVIIKNSQAIIIDTPFDNKKTERLVNFLRDSMQVEVKKLIIGHYHSDCLGGLDFINRNGIESLANILTVEKCIELNLPIPTVSFKDKMNITFNELSIECSYFGAGHTIDNITVWIPEYQILFGGCLVKSMNSKTLGNLQDALVDQWGGTIQEIIDTYKHIEIVVPGHGKFGSDELLKHTLKLVEDYEQIKASF